MEKQKNRNK